MKTVHGGTPPGLASPGSRVSERISCGVPIPPSTISRWAAAKSRANRRLKPTCSGTPASFGGRDRPVRLGQRHRHRLLAEDRLAGGRRRHDQLAVRRRRRGDHDGVDVVGVDQRLRVVVPDGAERSRPARPRRRAAGRRPPPAAASGTRRAMISACEAPIRPAPIRPMRRGVVMVRSWCSVGRRGPNRPHEKARSATPGRSRVCHDIRSTGAVARRHVTPVTAVPGVLQRRNSSNTALHAGSGRAQSEGDASDADLTAVPLRRPELERVLARLLETLRSTSNEPLRPRVVDCAALDDPAVALEPPAPVLAARGCCRSRPRPRAGRRPAWP